MATDRVLLQVSCKTMCHMLQHLLSQQLVNPSLTDMAVHTHVIPMQTWGITVNDWVCGKQPSLCNLEAGTQGKKEAGVY